MDKIEKDLEEYFTRSIPKMSEEKKNEINQIVVNQKPRRAQTFYKFAMIIFLIALIPLTAVLITKNKDNTKYYADGDLTSVTLNQSELTNILTEDYPQYLSTLNETYLYEMFGFYGKEDNVLVYVKIVGFTDYSEYNMILTFKNFNYDKHNVFTENAIVTNNYNYKMYRKNITTAFKDVTYVLLEYENYKLYLTLDGSDEDFLEKIVNS